MAGALGVGSGKSAERDRQSDGQKAAQIDRTKWVDVQGGSEGRRHGTVGGDHARHDCNM